MILIPILGLIIFLYIFCIFPGFKGSRKIKNSVFDTDYAHRGLWNENSEKGIPENSLAAFRNACEKGYGIELDIQLSKDGEVIVFHDYTLERMTGVGRKISECTYEELPIRIEVDDSFTREIIWTDEDVIDICEPKNAIIIDVTQIYTGSYKDVFVQLISDYGSQLQLGYLGADGKMLWNESQNGWYYLQLQWFDRTNNDKLMHSESYKIRIKDSEITVDEKWDGEMKVYE